MSYLRGALTLLLVMATAVPNAPIAGAADYTLEADSLVVSPAGAGAVYANASASGGTALILSKNSTASQTVSLPDTRGITIRAAGQKCNGWPNMTVKVDATAILTTTVSTQSWTDYTVPVTIPAGSHTVAISFTNDYYRNRTCDRNLLLDKITVTASTPTTTPPAGFVYRQGNALMLNGVRYRFVGVNNYGLTGAHTGYPVSAADGDAFFAQLPPHTMVRVWAFEEWGLDAVTQTVRLAEKYDQKLILALEDGSGQSGRAPQLPLSWYQGGYTGPFYNAAWGRNINYWNWVSTVASAFKDSPAVAAWEIMNEPGSTASGLTTSVIKQFYDAVAGRIKQIDPIHLVSTGALAPWQTFQQGATGYAQAHSGPNIDLISVHEYDYPYSNGATLGSYWYDTAAQAAQALGKPVYVGETGISLANGCMTSAQRADILRKKFDLYLNSNAAGVLYWTVTQAPNNPGTVCNYSYGNNDPMVGGDIMDTVDHYVFQPVS